MFHPENHARLPNHNRRLNDCYVNPIDFAYRPRRSLQNYGSYRFTLNGAETRFDDDHQESGTRTPPLWRNSPPSSPTRNLYDGQNYRSLSPTSRTREIAKGQRELMEMVRNMPESCYELSLKDLVEKPMMTNQDNRKLAQPAEEGSVFSGDDCEIHGDDQRMIRSESVKRQSTVRKSYDVKAQMMRSGSLDSGGFLLKMVFPVSSKMSSKPKKMNKSRSSLPAGGGSKVSPRPSVSDGSAKGVDKDWWKKKLLVSGDGENDGGVHGNDANVKTSRSNSSGSTGSRSRQASKGCWPFIRIKRSKLPK